MSNSNDNNKALTVLNEKLPAEQNTAHNLLSIIDEKIESGAIYGDQDFLNKVKELRDLVLIPLLQFNQWDLLGAIMYVLFDNSLSLHLKRYIVDNLINIIKNHRSDLLLNFCVEHVFPFTGDRGIFKAQAMSQIRIKEDHQKKMNTINVQLWGRERKHEQDVRFAEENKRCNGEDLRQQKMTDSEIVPIDYFALEESFIEENWLVKIMQDGESKIYYWDNDTRRYVSFETKVKMTTALKTYAYEKYGNQINLSSNEIDSVINRMIYSSVPLLDKSDRVQSSRYEQIFFRNAYVDLKESCYHICDTRNYFHVFCLPCDFPEEDTIPANFEKLLDYMFECDKTKKTLVYEIIGAIVSNVPLKNVFVFQGLSNGGKSTLAEIIMRLFDENDFKIIGSINEIDENKSKKDEGRIKLLYIDDAPNEKWNTSTVSYLKTRSRGIKSSGAPSFKVLLSTNYSIAFKTEDGRDESMENRIVAVPFEKDLKTATKEDNRIGELIQSLLDGRLEKERPYILKSALQRFIVVLKNGIEFVRRYPLNACVIKSETKPLSVDSDTNDEPKSKASPEKCSYSQKISAENSYLTNWLKENFELTDNEKEYLKAETILDFIKEIMPDTEGRVNDVGGPVKAVFGKDCCWSKRKDNKTWYKIKRKS